MRLGVWFKSAPTLAIIGAVLCLTLVFGGGLLLWGSRFATDMVHGQLAAQRISFPPVGSAALNPAEYPGLQQYGGQLLDSGPKAKAYADEFIGVHLTKVAGGKTYAEVSAAAQATPSDQALAGQVQTLFRGETLRALLLYAWGWSLVAQIAYWAGVASLLGAGVVFVALLVGFLLYGRAAAASSR